MPHHFPKGCIEAACWCKRCNGETPWRVMDGRRQYCIPCYERGVREKEAVKPNPEPPAEQGRLF